MPSSRTTTWPTGGSSGAAVWSTSTRIDTALLTIEAENDELCRPGQTEAAHRLCTGIPDERASSHHLQPGVGHYGVFSGTRFEAEIYPEIRDFVVAYD